MNRDIQERVEMMEELPHDGATAIEVPLSRDRAGDWSGVLRAGRLGTSLYIELGEVSSPDEDDGLRECARLLFPARVGPDLLDALHALVDERTPSAIVAIDENHTFVVNGSAAPNRVSLQIHPRDIFSWEESVWHVALELPFGVLPGLVDAFEQLTPRQ